MNQKKPFKWKHFQGNIILLCVRWYLRYSLSYRNLEEMMLERGLTVDHTTIYRWVQIYAPEIEKRSRFYLKPTNDSWRVDETYIKVKGEWKYLYRAVDSQGNTLEFMLSATRDRKSAARFLRKAIGARHNQQPRVINVDKNAAYLLAVEALKQEKVLKKYTKLRPIKYLNNIIEQDEVEGSSVVARRSLFHHRFIKKLVKPGLGFQSFYTAWRTIRGYEIMNMIRKGQVNCLKKGEILEQNNFIESLFDIAV